MASFVWPVTPKSLEMTRQDFECSEVYRSCNPAPESGYAHGPIPDRNAGWLPKSVLERLVQTGRQGKITVADIQDGLERNPTAYPMVSLNKINGLVCDIAVSRDGLMCGLTYSTQAELRKHLRNKHPGATRLITSVPQPQEHTENGKNALKRWVFSCGWRYARYLNEPGHGSENSLIRQYCDALERFAREDPQFARKYGTQFHRPSSAEVSARAEVTSTEETSAPAEPDYVGMVLPNANLEDVDWNAVLTSLQETTFDSFEAMDA